ncbi:MAG: glutathione S-transferase [Flavobacteriales bacterium]|jgi:glutathione S-transferase
MTSNPSSSPSSSPSISLVSFALCPFVQRSRILLNHKALPYEIEYIDLSDKPAWFLERVPTGKVPALFVGDEVLFESAVINEYIDETSEGSLLPNTPLPRAKQRALIAYSETLIVNQYRLLAANNEEDYTQQKQLLLESIVKLSVNPVDSHIGELDLFDASIAPLFVRIRLCPPLYAELKISLADKPEFLVWIESLLTNKAVIESTNDTFEQDFKVSAKRTTP